MRTNGLDRNGLNNYPANNTLNVFLDLCLPCMETLCTDILLNTEESCWIGDSSKLFRNLSFGENL